MVPSCSSVTLLVLLCVIFPQLKGDNALFRNPETPAFIISSSAPIPVPLTDRTLTTEIIGEDEDENVIEHEDNIADIVEPFLPPQINYDKVNKYSPFGNDTADLFTTFYFHPSFRNIILLFGLLLFTAWVIIMNLFTVIGLWRTHRRGHITDLYLANMAAADTILGVLVLPLMSVVILLGYFPFAGIVCNIWVFVDYYLIVAGSFGSCALMCNYLWMMKWPNSFPLQERKHVTVIALCWILVNLSWTPSFFNDRMSVEYEQGQCGFSVSRNRYYSLYIGITGFYIPLAISLICTIWSLTELNTESGGGGIPLLSLKQSISIGRRKRSSKFANEIIWTFFKILPDAIINSLEVDGEKRKVSGPSIILPRTPTGPKFFGPGAEAQQEKYNKSQAVNATRKRPPQLKHIKQQRSITGNSQPTLLVQMARDHYPLVVTSLGLFILCRSLFYIYFGVGSFVRNFFPLDLSNGVYWLMHSNAAISPLIHFAFDPELRVEVGRMLGVSNITLFQRKSEVGPEVGSTIAIAPGAPTSKHVFRLGRNTIHSMSRESTISNWSVFSANNGNPVKDTTMEGAGITDVIVEPQLASHISIDVNDLRTKHP